MVSPDNNGTARPSEKERQKEKQKEKENQNEKKTIQP